MRGFPLLAWAETSRDSFGVGAPKYEVNLIFISRHIRFYTLVLIPFFRPRAVSPRYLSRIFRALFLPRSRVPVPFCVQNFAAPVRHFYANITALNSPLLWPRHAFPFPPYLALSFSFPFPRSVLLFV